MSRSLGHTLRQRNRSHAFCVMFRTGETIASADAAGNDAAVQQGAPMQADLDLLDEGGQLAVAAQPGSSLLTRGGPLSSATPLGLVPEEEVSCIIASTSE